MSHPFEGCLGACQAGNAPKQTVAVCIRVCFAQAGSDILPVRRGVRNVANTYRRLKSSDTWHFCSNCSNWPTSPGYEVYSGTASEPSSGELCDECKAKRKAGDCS